MDIIDCGMSRVLGGDCMADIRMIPQGHTYGYIGKPPVDWARWVIHARFVLFVEALVCYSLWLCK